MQISFQPKNSHKRSIISDQFFSSLRHSYVTEPKLDTCEVTGTLRAQTYEGRGLGDS